MKKCMLCEREARAKGFCINHYKYYMNPVLPKYKKKIKKIDICSVEKCNREVVAKTYCRKHYEMFLRKGIISYVLSKHKCAATGCLIHTRINNVFCKVHQNSYERPNGRKRGEEHHSWNGGVSYFKNHYRVKQNRKRLIKERGCVCGKCGKEVLPSKIHQHHLNGNKDDHNDNNIILLCQICHLKMPKNKKKYGDKNLQEWASFFNITFRKFYNTLHRWELKTGLSKSAGIGLMLCLSQISDKKEKNS